MPGPWVVPRVGLDEVVASLEVSEPLEPGLAAPYGRPCRSSSSGTPSSQRRKLAPCTTAASPSSSAVGHENRDEGPKACQDERQGSTALVGLRREGGKAERGSAALVRDGKAVSADREIDAVHPYLRDAARAEDEDRAILSTMSAKVRDDAVSLVRGRGGMWPARIETSTS